jgi:dienelactone hydrolase
VAAALGWPSRFYVLTRRGNPLRPLLAFVCTLIAASTADARCRVGVEVRTVFDGTRGYGAQARPIRLVLWYPARTVTATPLTRLSLVGAGWLSAHGATPGWDDWAEARRTFASRLTEMRSPVAARRALTARTCAGWLSPVRPGTWPLVLLGSGLTSGAYFHSQLAEDLAEAGFVVAFVSVLGPAPGVLPRFDAESVRMLTDDAAQAIRRLQDDPRVDAGRVSLVGWSVSGIAHLALARDVRGVRAAVSLDSGVGYDYGARLWAETNGGRVSARRYLHLRAGIRSPVSTDEAILTQLGAEVDIVPGLTHAQFTDLPWDDSRISAAQASMRRRVRDFLLTYVAR